VPVDWEALGKEPGTTESSTHFQELYTFAQYHQLDLPSLQAKPDDDLIYLAAHDPAVEDFGRIEDGMTRQNKLENNARRARLVLGQRWSDRAAQGTDPSTRDSRASSAPTSTTSMQTATAMHANDRIRHWKNTGGQHHGEIQHR
jgi:hypothetical protein